MMEKMRGNIPLMNLVEGFNPAEYTRELVNEDGSVSLYLDVKYRLLWFRLVYPNGKIDTEIIQADDRSAVVSCKLYASKEDPPEQYIARSSAQRFSSEEKFGSRYLETAETAAMGRVLAAAGFGTQFCGSSDMLSGILADAPVETRREAGKSEPESSMNSRAVHPNRMEGSQKVESVVSSIPAREVPSGAEMPATLEELLQRMTLEDAKNVKVDVGIYAGHTLGEIALRKPVDLEWYVRHYAGKNLALKAGSMILLQAVGVKVS